MTNLFINKKGFTLIESIAAIVIVFMLSVLSGLVIYRIKVVKSKNKKTLINELFISSIYQYFNAYPDNIEIYLMENGGKYTNQRIIDLEDGKLYTFSEYPEVSVGIFDNFDNYYCVIYLNDEEYVTCRRLIKKVTSF